MNDSLGQQAKEIQDYMREGRTGPTLAAAIVVKVAAEWEAKHRAKHGDKAFETWLRSVLGRGASLRYFELRQAAALRFGGCLKGRALFVEHQALVWLNGRVADDKLEKFGAALSLAFRDNRNQPLSLKQATRVYVAALGKTPARSRPRCTRCAALEAELAQLKAK